MDAFEFIAGYWWLAFPLSFAIIGIARAAAHNDIERKRLDIIKAYADKGMEIPDALKRQTF